MMFTITDQDGITYNIANASDAFSGLNAEERGQLEYAKQTALEAFQSAYQKQPKKEDSLSVPEILLSDSMEPNFIDAAIDQTSMEFQPVICYGMVKRLRDEIEQRYPVDWLLRTWVAEQDEYLSFCQRTFEYGIKFLALHELFHMWHGHLKWQTNYYIAEKKQICKGNGMALYAQYKPIVYSINYDNPDEVNRYRSIGKIVIDYHLSQQALEADADRSAISSLTNTIIADITGKDVTTANESAKIDFSALLASIATVNYIFHHNARKQYSFKTLPDDLLKLDHPTPAVRYYMEQSHIKEIIRRQIKDDSIRRTAFDAILAIDEHENEICNRDGEQNPFYATAYCNIGQEMVMNCRMRYNLIYLTLKQFADCKLEKTYPAKDICIDKEAIRYNDFGEKLQ